VASSRRPRRNAGSPGICEVVSRSLSQAKLKPKPDSRGGVIETDAAPRAEHRLHQYRRDVPSRPYYLLSSLLEIIVRADDKVLLNQRVDGNRFVDLTKGAVRAVGVGGPAWACESSTWKWESSEP
jgi:hypothetical protein